MTQNAVQQNTSGTFM